MTKSWRERIVEARERGEFTEQDKADMANYATCFVGEQVQRGLIPEFWDDSCLEDWGAVAFRRVQLNSFAEAERLLDRIEDRALRLKREKAG